MSYQQGSLDGAVFFTEMTRTTFGRRTATYELPFDEKGVASVDLGRAARRFHIKAILLDTKTPLGVTTHLEYRDKLVKVLEKPGPKLLVHPDYGRVMVTIKGDIDLEQSTDEGGLVKIDFKAIESREPLPAAGPMGLLDAANSLRDSAVASFVERLVTEGPDFILEDVNATLDDAIYELRKVNNLVTAVLELPAQLTSRLDAISTELSLLLQTPRRLIDAFDGFIESLLNSTGRVYNAASQRDVPATLGASHISGTAARLMGVDFGDPIPSRNTPARQQQRENRAAITQAIKSLVLANAAKALSEIPPTSQTEAQEVAQLLIDEVVNLADGSEQGVETPADMYASLKDLAGALGEYARRVAGGLAATRQVYVAAPIPVEVFAYQLYGDAERADEIRDLNPQVVTAIIPGGTTLTVLVS